MRSVAAPTSPWAWGASSTMWVSEARSHSKERLRLFMNPNPLPLGLLPLEAEQPRRWDTLVAGTGVCRLTSALTPALEGPLLEVTWAAGTGPARAWVPLPSVGLQSCSVAPCSRGCDQT